MRVDAPGERQPARNALFIREPLHVYQASRGPWNASNRANASDARDPPSHRRHNVPVHGVMTDIDPPANPASLT
jgi:hypothetical protein